MCVWNSSRKILLDRSGELKRLSNSGTLIDVKGDQPFQVC
jgi:hypothetical protein